MLLLGQRSGFAWEAGTLLPLSLTTERFLPAGHLQWVSKHSYEIGSYPKLNNILEDGTEQLSGQIWHVLYLLKSAILVVLACVCPLCAAPAQVSKVPWGTDVLDWAPHVPPLLFLCPAEASKLIMALMG